MDYHKYYITDGITRARVNYSTNIDTKTGKKCIVIREKDYENNLPKVFEGVRNNTDLMTDYFEENHIHLLEGSVAYETLFPLVEKWGFVYA